MSEPLSPQEAPKQPHIDKASWNGSNAEIYNPYDLCDQARSGVIRLFDRADFNSPIERAQLNLEPVQTVDNEPAIGISGKIQLDRSRSDLSVIVEKMKKSFVLNYEQTDRGIDVKHTAFINLFFMGDVKDGVKALVAIYDNGSIELVNQGNFTSPSTDKQVNMHAPAIDSVDGAALLRGTARLFMRVLDYANGSTESYGGKKALSRTYKLGETTKPVPASLPKSLGSKAISKSTERSSSPSSTSMVEQLGVDILEQRITLDEVGGLGDVKARLLDIAVSFKNPEIMAKWGAERPQGILFYGEPGTGKTMLVTALANEIGAKLWSIQGSDIYNMWLGESERKVKELFAAIRALKEPTVILFDEFDSMIGISEEPGPGGGGQARNAVAGIFKQEMNTLAEENPNVLVVATTNHPDRIDEALIRSGRFDHRIYVPMPDTEGRLEIISSIMSRAIIRNEGDEFKPYGDDINISKLAEGTDGLSGADIAEIFRRITLQKAMQEARSGSVEAITQDDLLRTLKDFRTQG